MMNCRKRIDMKKLLGADLTEPYFSVGLLILRVGAGGGLLLLHGIAKLVEIDRLTAFVSQRVSPTGAPVLAWLMALSEVAGSVLVMAGFATRLAALAVMATTLIAVSVAQLNDPYYTQERAALYLLAFLTLLCTGAGKFSIDGVLGERRDRSGGLPSRQARGPEPAGGQPPINE
jgi:putative oxidoreductase